MDAPKPGSLPDKGVLEFLVEVIQRIFPQNASGDLKLCPLTSKLCNFCTGVCLVIAAVTHMTCDYAETRPAVGPDEDPWMRFFLQTTASCALAGLLYETSISCAINVMNMKTVYQEEPMLRTRLRLNMKMRVVFTFLTTLYHCMALDIQWVHKGWLADYYGGHQIVYSLRYIEWTCCAPIVFSISGQLQSLPDGTPRNGIIPSALLTGIYCIISWQGLVVTNFWAAWICIGWAFVSYFVASVEQLLFAWHLKDIGRAGKLRAGLLTYLVIMVGIYGAVYLLPIPGLISATMENKFYCVFDASFKLGTSVMIISTYDISYNEEMRRRSESTAEDLQVLIDTASVPIFTVDRQCCIAQWNQKAATLTGLSSTKAVGMRFFEMISDESKRKVAEDLVKSVLDGEKVGCFETVMRTQVDKTVESVLTVSVSPRRDKSGTITGAMLVGCDLTEVEAFKEAEVRKTRFMAVMSHELRSPLHGIKGLAERLADDELDTTKARALKMIGNCATRLLDLVVNIMGMASLSQTDSEGKSAAPKMQRDPVEVQKIIEEICTLVRSSTDKAGNPLLRSGVTVHSKVQNLPIIEADTHRCTQVFYNILTNACKFTLKGKITVHSRVDPNGHWVEVSVTDTGRGIPENALERIFKPFEQEDMSESRHYEGIGLGLSIAKQIVKLHGGRIDVRSKVGVGTTFSVRLPTLMGEPMGEIPDVATEDSGVEDSPEDAGCYQSTQGANRKSVAEDAPECVAPAPSNKIPGRERPLILSVDDDEINQMVIKSILDPHYDVHIAMDGPEALEYMESIAGSPPDCILLDVMMPEMSGYEVCKTVRQRMKLDVPILMLSADPTTAASSKGFESGCNDYITKPFHRQILLAHVSAVLQDDVQ